jgi:ferredoxin/flavodoxin---NADP+ reductase
MNTPHPLALEKYNATLVEIKHINDQLKIFRVKPDYEMPQFQAGQFVTIGLGAWEERTEGCQIELNVKDDKIGRRAYSICSPVFNDNGSLFDHNQAEWFELYVTLVTEGKDEAHSPYLTPRLFNLCEGDRMMLSSKIAGHYLLEDIKVDDNIIFLATGTGQAPHNAMMSQLLRNGHKGKILSMECNKTFDMCGYAPALKRLADEYENVYYRQLATREGDDRTRIQKFIADGRIKSEFGIEISPETTKVFLCGNPAMIGIPKFKGDEMEFTSEGGAVELLVKNYGMKVHHGHTPGEIYYEKYW